jgi:hypothetical protein
MPKIRRTELPEAVFRHLLLRAHECNISADQFVELSSWLNSDPPFLRADGSNVSLAS